ncbi:SDR family oxidoreductase [Paraflavitalea sp. CAU 1676]|uniref:SDR family oxidoreductase n=1 Tax=Paraflavitalea sp. CAU 1676 TaxID=3032598 RepID=UPI0023DB352A|nr:SDR family oxidoreductase [Paraflavitalea sp. CAU 1676]MDF2192531.1 SDR family oxidoreductase [Paraflavitalea sp. CAU 1676]
MNTSLQGKTAVIGGSTQGIGFAIAQELAGLGATCILLARNETTLKEVAATLPKPHGQQHSYQVADFSQPTQVKQAIDNIVAKQPVHLLINNTGGPTPGPISDAAPEAFLAAFNQHIICNQLLVQAVIPGMKAAAYGRIINIVSTSVRIPIANLGVSNTIRGATASWAKTLANELGQFGITVNNILPGLTKTQRLTSLIQNNAKRSNRSPDEIEKEMLKEIPARRFGEAAELAALAAFLAGPAAAYINGTSIPVDGGKTGSI